MIEFLHLKKSFGDLLVLDGGALVPMPFVVEHTPGRVVVDPPEGLL